MLRINRETDYAVRVILALAKRGDEARLFSNEIQREMLIPPTLMPRIVARLARTGLLNTFPGREGGLMLSRPSARITLKDVVEAFEGPILLSQCLQARGEDDCPFRVNCPVSPKWGRVQVAMLREMASITFEALAQESLSVPMVVSSFVS
ncbi:MAG: Rrf2 family transcriptional regulator [Chloroflexi bacterium]|nr:Rrf2 family transcriptional regulator [Chloroflexota bacterium]MBI1856146.1 Rrf2 family transcriptional regulator [Chloroflexota bacterium]MBI3340922.1 Rrf2 family transcriptional regulator [Chloroflexota bacterium]